MSSIYSLLLMAAVITFTHTAHAQYGYGLWGGMQSCGYNMAVGENLQDVLDDIEDLDKQLDSLKDQRDDARTLKKSTEKEYEKFKKAITNRLTATVSAEVIKHYEQKVLLTCAAAYPSPVAIPVQPNYTAVQIATVHCTGGTSDGFYNGALCDNPVAIKKFATSDSGPACVEALGGYPQAAADYKAAKEAFDALEKEIKSLQGEIKRKKNRDIKKAIREDQEDGDSGSMEGGLCVGCLLNGNGNITIQKPPSTGQIIGNLALAGAGLFAGYKMGQYSIDSNAKLGIPSQPGMSPWLYGVPFALAGIYGALGGGGSISAGAYGCAPGMNGGGFMNGPYGMMGPFGSGGGLYGNMGMGMPWGNPYMMMNPMAGGMFMPGMNGMGMNPYMMMGGMPGMMMGGMMGMMMGGPMMGGMMPGMMMGGMMGMMMGGPMMGGMMPGMMMGNMMMPGMMMGGMLGMMMNGGMMMGSPMMGGMMPGMMMGGMMGVMMNGGMMMGNMMGNMMYGGMMPGMMMGGMMGGMMGMMMGGGMDGGLGGLQMQQMMMQSQMQAYQSYISMQRQQADSMTARFRVIAGLQEELAALNLRLNQAYMGVGVDASYSSDPYNSYYYRDSGNPSHRPSPSGPNGRRSSTGR